MQADTKPQTSADCRGHLDRLAQEVLESCGLVMSELPEGVDPFDRVADSMFEAVEKGERRLVRRLTTLLDFAILVRRADIVDDPKVLGELTVVADKLAQRLLISGHPASASASGLRYVDA